MRQLEEVKEDYQELIGLAAKFTNPRRELSKDSQRFDKKGQKRGRDIFDGTPMSALGIWRDGMQGFMASKSLDWFKSEMSDYSLNPIDEVRKFLQEYDEAMYSAYRSSNYYSILNEWFNDAGSVGTATVYTEEDIKRGTSVHTPLHLREVFIAENQFQQVDVLFRKFFLTARQAVQKFDNNRLTAGIVANAKNHPEKPHEFIHACFPNEERQFGSIASTNKKYKSVYVETKGSGGTQTSEAIITNSTGGAIDGIVKEGGYDYFPYSVWRFRKNSDEVYGYSPAMDFMVGIEKLNTIGKTLLQAAHLSVRPAKNIPEHMRGNVHLGPDGHNYYEKGGEKIENIESKINFPVGIDREELYQKLVLDGYHVEFFKAFIGRKGEATREEILQIKAEQAQLMGPQVDRLTEDGLSKNFDAVAAIENAAGRLPEPPQILIDRMEEEKELGVLRKTVIVPRFTGPLAQAQKRMFTLQPIQAGLDELGKVSVFFPNITDIVKEVKLGEYVLDATDFPQEIMNSQAEIDEIRKARQEAIERQQQIEMAGQAADAVPKLQKKTEEGSPLEAITGAA